MAKKRKFLKRKSNEEKSKSIKKKENVIIVKGVNKDIFSNEYESEYPFSELDNSQGFFVPNERAQSTEENLKIMRKAVTDANDFYSEIELTEDGDEVWETVIVKTKKRNPDSSLILSVEGKPIEGADSVTRPVVIFSRHFIAYAVDKDHNIGPNQKVSEDGVLVVRVN